MPILDQFKKQFTKWVTPEEEEEFIKPPPLQSGGFESIYALENVDPNTVRPMGSGETEIKGPVQLQVESAVELPKEVVDEALDLGSEYRGWIRSFRLDEPVQALGLSPMAEKTLKEKGMLCLGDLLDEQTEQMLPLTGMGQGHIDEIQLKVRERLKGKGSAKSGKVDYASLIRGVTVSVPQKECWLLLRQYGLSELCQLSMAQSAELRHLGEEKEQQMIDEAKALLQTSDKKERIREGFRQIADVFLKPWIRARQGLAKEQELMDRLEEIGEAYSSEALRFLVDLFFDGKIPLGERLLELDPGVYAADYSGKQQYQKVLNIVHSYFYNADLHYPLSELLGLIGREMAKRWDGVPEGLVVKALKLCPDFRVRRDERGELVVRMAWWVR